MQIAAVIPAYREAQRIGETVRGVLLRVDTAVVVDDGSDDETTAKAQAAGAIVLRHVINRGQGAALATGTQAALRLGSDLIVHVDADGQHDPSFIPVLTAPIVEHQAEIVFGSRFLGVTPEGMPLTRRLLLHGGRSFNAFAMGIPRAVTDPQSGMRALSRRAAEKLDFRQDRYAHASEILRLATRSELKWMEVPVRVHYTEESLSKGQKNLDAIKIAWQLLLGAFMR